MRDQFDGNNFADTEDDDFALVKEGSAEIVIRSLQGKVHRTYMMTIISSFCSQVTDMEHRAARSVIAW